jgi:hypothetical protein
MRSLAPHCHVCFGSSDSSPQQQGDQLFVVVFFFVLVTQPQWVFYLFSNVGKKVYFILLCGFCTFGRCKFKKKQGLLENKKHSSTKLVDGMGGVMSERGLEGWKMQKHVQANVEDGALAPCNVNEEQVQMNVEVGETYTTNLATIEVDLQKII